MAILELADGAHFTLPARCVVGRAPGCGLRIAQRSVSGEHATISWTVDGWQVRDLGSSNGTFVDEAPLPPGPPRPLAQGATLRFGPDIVTRLIDDGPPRATAIDLDSGAASVASDGMLVLPDEDTPRCCIFDDPTGWLAEIDGEPRRVQDAEIIRVEARAWRLHLPTAQQSTVAATASEPTLETITLRFQVSADEEYAAMSVVHGADVSALPAKAHHYTLLTLARARAEAPDPTDPDAGWVYVDDLCKMLGCDDLRLNVDVYRARKELGRLGLVGSGGIVERRRLTKQIRIGVARLAV